MLDSIIHILKPVTKETFKIVPKGISSSTLVKEELIADKPDIVIAHLHSFGSQDHGFESELTKLIEGYSSANSHRTEFIVFSRSFEDGTAYYMDSMSTRLDTVRQNIHPIYLPAASEINSLHQEELRNLFKSLTTKS